MDNKICISGYGLDETVYLAIGLYFAGCSPIYRDCESFIRDRRDKLVLTYNGRELSICSGECDISINNYRNGVYMHLLTIDGEKIVEGYITDNAVNKYILAGMIYCYLSRGYDLYKAFNESMKIFSIGKGDPFNYFQKVLNEYNGFNRLLDALERLVNNRELLRKTGSEKILLGFRSIDDKIYDTMVYNRNGEIFTSRINRIDLKIYSEYEIFNNGEAFICMEKRISENIDKYEGYRVTSFKELECIVSNDPVKIIILLEKILS